MKMVFHVLSPQLTCLIVNGTRTIYDTRKSRNLYETETYTKLKSCGTFHISYVIFRERCCFIFYVASKSGTIRSCSYRNVYSLEHLIKRLYICCSVFVSRRLIKRQRLLEWPLKTLLFGRTCCNLLIKDSKSFSNVDWGFTRSTFATFIQFSLH